MNQASTLVCVSRHETGITPKAVEICNRLTQVSQQLIKNSKYSEVRSVQCEVHEGLLFLRGQVSSYHLKQLAQEVVSQVEGIEAIVNCIEVVYPDSRWHQSGPGDDVVDVVNLSHNPHCDYRLGFPSEGTWRVRLNSDWNGYSAAFANTICSDVVAQPCAERRDGFPFQGNICIGPYSVPVLSQDKR